MQTARSQGEIDSARVRTQADIDQRNRQLMANLKVEQQKIAGMSEERRNSKQGQALTAALGRLNDATRNLTKVSDDNKMGLSMKDSKDPAAQTMYKQAATTVSTAQSTYDEAKKIFDTIAAEALKGYATTPAATPGANTAKPDFVFDSKTGKMVPNK
jgi:lipoprotein-anchoring transpeptidase ErfK/SrfK